MATAAQQMTMPPLSSEKRHPFRHLLQSALFPLARRFIAGTSLQEALHVVQALNVQGFLTTLDYLGENVTSVEGAHLATEHNIILLRALHERHLDLNISVKPTQLGLAIDRDLFEKNLTSILTTARSFNAFIRVDIEGSSTTTDTFEVVRKLKAQGYPVGAAVQAMLRRTHDDVVALLQDGVPLRLCKGAYKEPARLAFKRQDDIREQYLTLAKRLLSSDLYHGMATHDEVIIEKIKAFVETQGIPRDRFEFQLLYGMRQGLQQLLRKQGWRVRIYVPFGRAWLPYVLRRLRERKENVWFLMKGIFQK